MHIEFCTKLIFLEGEYAITQNIGFLLSWVGTPCRYLVLRPESGLPILNMPFLRWGTMIHVKTRILDSPMLS
jgi:hypothetical protein